MAVWDFLFGSDDKMVSPYDKGQNQLLQYIMQLARSGPQDNPAFKGGQDWLTDLFGGDSEGLSSIFAPYLTQFEQQIAPGIANRYAGMGSGNLSSGSFQRAISNAGANLSQNLGALQAHTRLNALPQALDYAKAPFQTANSLAQTALSRPNQAVQPGNQGFLTPLLGTLASSFTKGTGLGLADMFSNYLSGRSNSPQTSTGVNS